MAKSVKQDEEMRVSLPDYPMVKVQRRDEAAK